MVEHNPPAHADRVPLIPLPIALYVSNGLVFELYGGGQPWRSFSIRWGGSFRRRKPSRRQPLKFRK
jgi:hypothetical protein